MLSEDARILLFTGDGKGKTTAALGLSVRAAGQGMRVCFIQFVKDRHMATGEKTLLGRINEIELFGAGLGRVPEKGGVAFQDHLAAARQGLSRAQEVVCAGDCELLVLDEICVAIEKGLISTEQVLDLLSLASAGQIIAMTGRHAPRELLEAADTVTEMKPLKHAYDTGRRAERGVEI